VRHGDGRDDDERDDDERDDDERDDDERDTDGRTDMTKANESWRRQSVADEAAEWLATCSDPSADAADRAAFVDWLRRSNLHVEEFLRLSALMQRVSGAEWPRDRIDELVARALESPNVLPLGRAGERNPARHDGTGTAGDREAGARMRPWAIAASVTLVLAAAAALGIGAFGLGVFGEAGTRYSTSVGEMRSIVLPDGSVVDLNTRSSVRARFNSKVRLIELETGEAIFKVTKDPARPFRVVAGDTEIVAVGTQFNVYAAQARTVVTVLEGRVRVTDRAAAPADRPQGAAFVQPAVELGSGEQAVIAPRRPIARVALADPMRVTSWTERRLIFEDATLASVAEEFARYSARVITVADPALAQRQITGVFDASDPASLVQFLGAQGGVGIVTTEEGWTLHTR